MAVVVPPLRRRLGAANRSSSNGLKGAVRLRNAWGGRLLLFVVLAACCLSFFSSVFAFACSLLFIHSEGCGRLQRVEEEQQGKKSARRKGYKVVYTYIVCRSASELEDDDEDDEQDDEGDDQPGATRVAGSPRKVV